MADIQAHSVPKSEGKGASGRHESVFVVENTETDLASLFAAIDKKDPGSSDKPTTTEKAPEPDPPPSGGLETPVEVSPAAPKGSNKRTFLLLFLGLSIAGAVAMGARQVAFKSPLGPAVKNPASIRHSIVVPSAVERLEVFLTARSKEKEDLVLMTLAVRAGRPNAEDILSAERVAVRDTVYGFLSQKHPEKNVRRSWAPIVEKELLVELQKRFPQAGIVAVELEELQKI